MGVWTVKREYGLGEREYGWVKAEYGLGTSESMGLG